MKTTKFNGYSMNRQEELLELLKQHAPEVFSDNKLDVKQLRATLGEEVVADMERYGLSWAGKMDCFRTIQKTTTNTLKPVREESVDFDTTENLFIEGDNLEVLKVLQRSYYGKVKMIYIDPPYNTGNDFIYNDTFSRNKQEYLEEVGAIDKEGNVVNAGLYTLNTKDSGHYHSDWLNMMYPRLFLAKNLLKQDGVIFISIDDNEVHNLRMIMNEIFGEENFVALLPTIMNLKGNQDEFGFAGTHEYSLVFSKSFENVTINQFILEEEDLEDWLEDEFGPYKKGANLKSTGGNAPRIKRPNLFFPIYIGKNQKAHIKRMADDDVEIFPITDGQEMSWRWSKEKIERENHNLIVSKNGEIGLYKKQRPLLGDLPSKKPKSIFYKPEYSSGNGTAQMKELFEGKIFSNPKPLNLIRDFIEIGSDSGDMIVDFFAGSGTTAHAVMQLNAEDGGSRKCISVQLPEKCKPDTEAAKAGFVTIADIAKERIRRAGKKIQAENLDKKMDIGFKAFKLDESNFKIWNTHVESVEQLEQQMIDMFDNVCDGSTKEAMLYELILKSGNELNVAIEEKEAGGEKFFKANDGSLVICLADKITKELFAGILVDKPKKIIVLDKSFGNDDQLKTNCILRAEGTGVDEVRVI